MPDNYHNQAQRMPIILIVQRQKHLRDKIAESLSAAGQTRITFVEDARSALKILRSQPIDALITEVDLEQIDGWRLSRLVRSGALRCKADIPIILTSSIWCERIAEVTAREHGINALISIEALHTIAAVLEDCIRQGFVLKKPRLLVIEDEEDTADLIVLIMTQRFEVECVYDGEAGLEEWLKGRHDLVLLDVMLPKMDGPEVLERIMQVQPNQPVVIMTAHASVEQAEELLVKGAADFVTKPFRPEQLRSVSEIALRRDDYMVSNQ
ncbi:MAG: response regulator, partial [Pseudomonadota bacterium]